MFEVFVDTIVICTLTALTILMSGIIDGTTFSWGGKYGAELTSAAFTGVFGGFSAVFVALAILLFAGSTILSWSLYGTRCAEFLFGEKSRKPYQVLFVLFIVVGATMDLSLAWDIADTLNGLIHSQPDRAAGSFRRCGQDHQGLLCRQKAPCAHPRPGIIEFSQQSAGSIPALFYVPEWNHAPNAAPQVRTEQRQRAALAACAVRRTAKRRL